MTDGQTVENLEENMNLRSKFCSKWLILRIYHPSSAKLLIFCQMGAKLLIFCQMGALRKVELHEQCIYHFTTINESSFATRKYS